MSLQPSSTSRREILWPSVINRPLGGDPDRRGGVRRSVCRRLGAPDPVRARQHRRAHPAGVLFALGVLIMIAFIRAAQRVEPFTRRA